jgi:hypothetical protein
MENWNLQRVLSTFPAIASGMLTAAMINRNPKAAACLAGVSGSPLYNL